MLVPPAGRDGIFERNVSAAAYLCAVCGMRCSSAACLYYRVGDLSAVCTESAFAAAFDTASVCVEDPLCGSAGSGTVRDTGSCGCGCRRRSGILCAGIYYR